LKANPVKATSMKQEPIRITYLVDFLRTVQAGTEKQLAFLLTALPQSGFKVDLISLQTSPFLSQEAFRAFPQIRIASLGANSDIARSIPAMFKLFCMLRKSQSDILHCFFPTSNSIGAVIGRWAGIRHIITSRRDMAFNLTRTDVLKLKAANPLVEAVIANSSAVKKKAMALEGIDNDRIHVIPNGIDYAAYENAADKPPSCVPVVGIVANLNRDVKRVDVFIRAAALVCKRHPETVFKVVGDGHLRPHLEGLAHSLGLNSQIRFEGRRSDVARLLREMDIGVICSDSEGLSNAIMEYMAAGLPVVATDCGGNAELVTAWENGLLVPTGNADALSRALSYLLENPERARNMGQMGRHFIESRFSIPRMLQETISLYQGIVAAT